MKKYISTTLVLILIFSFALPVHGASRKYTDATSTDWFYGSLGILSDNKIIEGYADGSFRPSDKLNVDQYITILCRLTDNDVGKANTYWAQNYIDFAEEAGWLDGMTFTAYNVPVNRYQAAKLTAKAMEYNSDKSPEELLEYKVYIEDYNSIPSKYRTDVLLNYAIGLTNGYPDGTYQGTNTLTRAEAAVISHRVFDPDERKLLLDPEKTAKLLALFEMDNLDQFALLAPEVVMPAGLMMFLPPAMPLMPMPVPLPIAALPLLPPVAIITENVLADTLIEMSDLESDNIVAAGYGYGVLNINLLSEENESILIYTAEDGSNTITLDLLLMIDDEGNLRADASDLILLVCKNIDEINGDNMHGFIMSEYAQRALIPEEGSTATFGETDVLMTNLTHDHNVTKVKMTVN